MPLDKMFEKAYELILKKRVERVGDEFYNVIGKHGTYSVACKIDGTVSCSCPGFARKGRCSHSLAVMMLNEPNLLRNIQKEFRKARGHVLSESIQR
ncbi:MAG: SWIM zinc finger family protein [Candidatus Bathyarchaeia archaeon]